MRKGLATLIVGLSLLIASATWAGFSLLRTTLNPERADEIADVLVDNEDVRETLTNSLAQGIDAQLPPGTAVAEEKLQLAAQEALQDSRVTTLFKERLAAAYRNGLEGNDEPTVIASDTLTDAEKELLNSSEVEASNFSFEVPTTGLSVLGSIRSTLKTLVPLGAIVSISGIVLALVVSTNKPQVLRRVSYWAFGACFFWLFVGLVLPKILESLAPSSAAIAAAALSTFLSSMIYPALILGIVGIVLLLLGNIWPKMDTNKAFDALDQKPYERQQLPYRENEHIDTPIRQPLHEDRSTRY